MSTPANASLRVVALTTDLHPGLAEFLGSQAEATVFHEPWWFDVLRETYGHRCDYWVALEDGLIRGVFPVVLISVPFFGSKVVALPYQYHCGAPLATSESAFTALLDYAKDRASEGNAKYFEIRSHRKLPDLAVSGFAAIDTQLCKTLVPLQGFDMKLLRKGHQQEIRKARIGGVSIELDATLDGLRTFWRLYRIEGRELAGPQAGWKFFDSLYRNADDRYRLWLAHHGSDCIGGLLTLDNGTTAFARHGAYSSSRAKAVRLSKAIFWRSMSDAASRGCTSYDFGISWVRDHGLIEFKEGWRGTTQAVMAYVLPLRSHAPLPGGYFEGYRFAKAIWRKLPLKVVDRVGHQITRWIG